jgi:hypothetical protein
MPALRKSIAMRAAAEWKPVGCGRHARLRESAPELLQEAGRLDLGDHMLFEVQPDADHPEIQNEGMRYDGFRYRAECRLAGMVYSRPFGVDVAFGSHRRLEWVTRCSANASVPSMSNSSISASCRSILASVSSSSTRARWDW